MFRATAKELAAKLGVEYGVAAAVVKLLVANGVAKQVELRPNPRGKGRGSYVYELPEVVTINLKGTLEKPVYVREVKAA